MMKKAVLGLAIAVMVIAAGCGVSEKKATELGFRFETGNGMATITSRYTGSAKDVRIPARIGGKPVTVIGDHVFEKTRLISVIIPDSVKTIGEMAFNDNQLTSVTIPNSVTSIGDYAFLRNQLTSVTIPNSVTYLGGFGANQLTSITIPNSVTKIGTSAFQDNQLTSVTIPNSVITINPWAFGENPLTSVTIGANVDIVAGSSYPTFPGNLVTVYIRGGRQAGTYTRESASSNTWIRQ
jgi:hypothetical protein